jgi:hypothetical protein
VPGPERFQSEQRRERERIEKHEDVAAEATVKEVMALWLKSAEGKKIYKKRKETVEHRYSG